MLSSPKQVTEIAATVLFHLRFGFVIADPAE